MYKIVSQRNILLGEFSPIASNKDTAIFVTFLFMHSFKRKSHFQM